MSANTKYKWLLLTIVWGGCFLLSYLNNNTIGTILENREKKEILQKDAVFWKQSSENISVVIEKQKLLTHKIDSPKLGLVFLDDAFNRLADDFNLRDLRVDMDFRQSQDNSMPVTISFNGLLKNGLSAVEKIQKTYAFLPFKQVKINQDESEKQTAFNVMLDYKYRIAGTDQQG